MTSSRKPGAQPGNKNALKHGIFSQFIKPADDQAMAGMKPDDRSANVAMARVAFQEAWAKRMAASTDKEQQSWDFIAHYWLDSANLYQNQAGEKAVLVADVWETFRDAVRAANDRQGVKR